MRHVLVLGVPRSGTTWIGESLGRCDETVYVHEPDGVHEPFAFRARTALPVGGILAPGAAVGEYERLWEGAFNGGVKAATLRDHLARRLYAGVPAAHRARFRNGGRRTPRLALANSLALPRVAAPESRNVVVKSVDAALTAEWVFDRFRPEVIVVRRDLRAVLASWITLDMRGPQRRNYEALRSLAQQRWDVALPEFEAPLIVRSAAVCSIWSVALHDAARRHGWMQLRYEDVAVDGARALHAAADQVGLTWGARADAYVQERNREGTGYATTRVAGSTIDTWKSKLTEEQIEAIETVVGCFPEELRN